MAYTSPRPRPPAVRDSHPVPGYGFTVEDEPPSRETTEAAVSMEIRDCTLPTAERPARLAEFETLFARAVRRVERVSAAHLRLELEGDPGLTTAVRDLTARESRCCSFFTFAVTAHEAATGESLTLDIEVPAGRADVLAAFARLAERPAGCQPRPNSYTTA